MQNLDIHWICYLSESTDHYYTLVEYFLVPYQVFTLQVFFVTKYIISYPTLHDHIVKVTFAFQTLKLLYLRVIVLIYFY